VPNLHALQEIVKLNSQQPDISGKILDALNRVNSGISLLLRSVETGLNEQSINDLDSLFGKDLQPIFHRIITNAFRPDIHFLPSDEQNPEWSGVSRHSAVLFRYAFSCPVELLESAQDMNIRDWATSVDLISTRVPGASHFKDERPLKRSTLKPRFLADLLTRFVAMHIRLGSPDFTEQTVLTYMEQLRGQ
jgi:hypothetical protein